MARVALVVDDSMLIRHTVCRFLEERGYAVESATNGQEALEMLKTVLPDVIITDMVMPKMDGSAFISELKSKPHTQNIPIVVIAGRRASVERPPDERANAIIFKDIEIQTQLEKVLAATFGMS
jgi:CheY-like chemotaxis protein